MADILNFPQITGKDTFDTVELLDSVHELLQAHTMEQIVLALMVHSTPENAAVIMPSFSKIALDNSQK